MIRIWLRCFFSKPDLKDSQNTVCSCMFQKHHLLCCCSLSSCHLPAVLRCFAAVFQASYAPCSPVHWAGITETECGQGTTARGFGVVTAVVRSYFNTSELQRATKRQYSPNERLAIVELFGCVQAISSTPGKTRLSSSELICRLILTPDLGFACRVRCVSCCMQITLDLQLVIHLCNHCSSSTHDRIISCRTRDDFAIFCQKNIMASLQPRLALYQKPEQCPCNLRNVTQTPDMTT